MACPLPAHSWRPVGWVLCPSPPDLRQLLLRQPKTARGRNKSWHAEMASCRQLQWREVWSRGVTSAMSAASFTSHPAWSLPTLSGWSIPVFPSSFLRAALLQQQVLSCISSMQACCVHPISNGSTKPETQKQIVEVFFLPNCPTDTPPARETAHTAACLSLAEVLMCKCMPTCIFKTKPGISSDQVVPQDKRTAVHLAMRRALGCTSEPSLCPAACPPLVTSCGLQAAPSPPAQQHLAAMAAPSQPPSPPSAQTRLWVPEMPAGPPLLSGESCAMLGMAGHGHFEYLVEMLEWGKVGTRAPWQRVGWCMGVSFSLQPFPCSLCCSIPFYF